MKHKGGKSLELAARKLGRPDKDDSDGKSRLRLLSDEVVRVVASFLPAVETPGVRPPAIQCIMCGICDGQALGQVQVLKLRTCGCRVAVTYCGTCQPHRLRRIALLRPTCEASCQMPQSYVPSTTLLRLQRRAAGSTLSRRDRDMAALSFVKMRLLEAGREVSAAGWLNVLGTGEPRPAPRMSAWLRRFGHVEAAIQWIQAGGGKFAQWLQRASLTQRRTRRVPEDYTSVQNAVDAANGGDRVLLAPGTYSEAVVVIKDLILEAPRRATIQSVSILPPGGDIFPTVLLVNLDLDCPALDTPACKVMDDEVPAAPPPPRERRQRLVMIGCAVRSTSVSGVVAEDFAQVRLIRCVFHDCGESGVFVRGGVQCALDDCRFIRNKASGLSAHNRAEVTAGGCDFRDNKENGVHASNASVTLRHCTARGNERRATFVQHGGRVDVDKTCSMTESGFGVRGGKGAAATPRIEPGPETYYTGARFVAREATAAVSSPPVAVPPPPEFDPCEVGGGSRYPVAPPDETSMVATEEEPEPEPGDPELLSLAFF